MVSNDIVDFVDAEFNKVIYQHICFCWVNGIQKGDFLAAFYQISVVACPIRQWNQLVKQPSVPVNCADCIDIWS